METHELSCETVGRDWFFENVDRETLSFSTPLASPELQENLLLNGIVQPLLLRDGNDNTKAVLICGHRRAACLRKISMLQQIPVLHLPHTVSLTEALALALAENTAIRKLNPLEKAKILTICLERLGLSRAEVIEKWFAKIGLQPNAKLLQSHLNILELPEAYQNLILQMGLTLKTIDKLTGMHAADALALDRLWPLLQSCAFGVNLLDECLGLFVTIAGRQRKKISEVVQELCGDTEVARVLADSNKEPVVKSNIVFKKLRLLATPTLTNLHEQFARASASLSLPPAVNLQPPPHFEGSRYEVQFKFGSRAELQKIASGLLESAEKPFVDDLLKLL